MIIDTGAGKVFPSLARVEKFLAVAERFCSMQSPPAQLWQVILGHLASLERLVPHGRLRMRSLQWHLKTQWSPESDPPSLPVALPEEVRWDLSWWMVKDHLLTGVRFGAPAPDLHLYSDASLSGWGAHLLDQNVPGVWSDQERLLHINLLEMKALFRTCEERFLAQKRSSYWPLPRLSVSVSSTLCRIESLIPGTGVRFPLLLSLVLWPRLRIPLPLPLGLRAFQYRPYQTRERIAMGDCCVLCGQSRFTSTALLHIVREVNGCSSLQGVARRRFRRPRSPSGSGRRYHALTSTLEHHYQCPPPRLVRRVVSLHQFFFERILLSTRC